MDKITSDRWAITKVSKFDDDQQYPKYLPGRLTYSNGFHCIFRTYNGDLGILTRDLYNIDGGLLSKNLTDTLTAIDKIKQGDPKHLHVPSIQRHLENALEILATHIPKASTLPMCYSCSMKTKAPMSGKLKYTATFIYILDMQLRIFLEFMTKGEWEI